MKNRNDRGFYPSKRERNRLVRRLERSIKELAEWNEIGVQIKKATPRKTFCPREDELNEHELKEGEYDSN